MKQNIALGKKIKRIKTETSKDILDIQFFIAIGIILLTSLLGCTFASVVDYINKVKDKEQMISTCITASLIYITIIIICVLKYIKYYQMQQVILTGNQYGIIKLAYKISKKYEEIRIHTLIEYIITCNVGYSEDEKSIYDFYECNIPDEVIESIVDALHTVFKDHIERKEIKHILVGDNK